LQAIGEKPINSAAMNRTLYTALFYLGLPLVAIRLWLRARKAPAYAKRIGERFSGMPPMQPGGIWVHAVSVGESIAAAPMIRACCNVIHSCRSPSPA
jgi:3-deoxy-D-manno-octulosonic-acid transferase